MGLVLGRVGAMNLALEKGERVTTGGKGRGDMCMFQRQTCPNLNKFIILPHLNFINFFCLKFS